MEAFDDFVSSCNHMTLENDQISKESIIHMPVNTYETSFLSDNLPTGLPNLSTSVLNDSNSSFTSASTAVFTIHLPNSQILFVNSAACQLLNYSSNELCSMKLVNLVSESHKYKLSKFYEKFLKAANEIHIKGKLLEFVKKDNDTISGLLYLKKINNPGQCLAIIKPLERKLGLVSVDQNGNVLSCDEPISLIFQYDMPEIVGLNIYTLLPKINLSKRNEEHWKKILKQHLTGRAKTGEVFPVSLIISSGNPNSVEECKIFIWVYTSLSGLILLNKKLLITNFNNNIFKLLFGLSKKDVLNQPIFNFIPSFCKNIGVENSRELYKNNVIKSNNFCWYKKDESFEDWDECFMGGEHMFPVRAEESSSSFGNFTLSSNQCEQSPSGLKADYEEDNELENLFRHEKFLDMNDEQRGTNSYYSSHSNRDHHGNKFTLHTVLMNTERNNSEPEDTMVDYYSTNKQNILVKEGKFSGFAKHYDGNSIAVKYHVKIVGIRDECFYYVWLSNDFYRCSDANERFNTNMLFSFNSTSFDSSLAKDSVCSEQYNRPSTASLISQCDETLIAGDYSQHYTNIRQIGKGAFGYVKMAYRNFDGLLVVTKFIKKQKINVRSWVFHSNLNMKIPLEISLLTTLQHPNIVRVLDVFHNDSFVQLVMEKHGAGFDLFEFINRGPNCDEKLKSYIFRQIISAVYYLNSLGILHRDIKDENVIINEKFEIKLIDFGSATFIPPNETFSKFYGTVEYCSPEVLQGNSYKGPELEIWALGVTLYVLTFGDNPFHNIEETIKGQFSIPFPISKELNHLLNQMLDKNVETRITIDRVAEDPWINQPVSIENYKFEEVVQCSDEEAYPLKYVHEINSEDFYGRDSRTDSNLLGDTNNSCGSLQNLTEMDELDADNLQQSRKSFKSEHSENKINIPFFMLSSTPIQWRKDRLSKSASGVTENSKISLSPSDWYCKGLNGKSLEKESHLKNDYFKHLRSTSSSENDSCLVKQEVCSSGFRKSDLEVRLKGCHLIEQENFDIGKTERSEKI